MIDKLQRKIFWIIQISLTSIILVITILYAVLSYRDSIMSATIMMDRLTGDDGRRIERPQELREQIEAEAYDIYRFSINNEFKIFRETNDPSNEIRNHAIDISKGKSEMGIIDKYIYKVRKMGNNEISVTLMENEDIVFNIKLKIILCMSIGLISTVIIYILAKKVSKTIVKPVEETLEKQKQFISDASHELKTPLAVIEANSDVLEDKVGKNKWITYIQTEIQSMNKLVNDLLLLAKIEDTSFDNYVTFNLSKEIEIIVSAFESMAYENQVNIVTNIQEDIEFNCDKEDIKHILSTLIDNGIKHTKKDKKVIIELTKERNEIKIQVKNEGDPILEEEQAKIFERFYRVDKARNRNEKRYGLGLAIAKRTVEKYGGVIEVICKDGITNFIVKLTD